MPHDAVALRPTRICRVPVALLRQIAETEPQLYLRLMSFWQRNLAYAQSCISQFSTGPIQARIARLILFRANIEGKRKPNEITLLNRQDMAAVLGVSQENISRCIAGFSRAKILRKIKRNVYFCDLPNLRDLAG